MSESRQPPAPSRRASFLGSIRTQILAQLVFAVIAFGTFAALYFPRDAERARTEDLLTQTELTGRLLAHQVAIALTSGDFTDLLPMTTWVRRQNEIRGLWVIPQDEMEIELVNKDTLVPTVLAVRPTSADLARTGPNGRLLVREDGENLYALHLLGDQGELGLLGFAFSKAQILRDASQSRKIAALFCLGLGVVLVIGGIFGTRNIIGPLTELERGANEIAEGNFEFSFGTMRNNECAALARSFEAMSRHMQKMIADLILESERAREASASKSQFLANMSHEIRTPMTAILGFSDELLRSDTSEEDRNDSIRTIQVNGKHLLGIINGILDLAKVEAGKLDLEQIPTSPFELIDSTHDLMKVSAQERGIALQVEYVTSLPETILTDPTRVRQVLINVVGNAIKFTEKGTVLLLASFEVSADHPMLSIRVFDSGIGMSKQQVEKVFEPFVQADGTTTRRFGGTGLGLTISHKLAQLLGGDILVSSEEGRGTIFEIRIPAGPTESHRLIEWEDFLQTRKSKTLGRGSDIFEDELNLRILVVDDVPLNCKLITRILSRQGAEVTSAENGQVALDQVQVAADEGRPFEMIVMDMQMPVLDGWEATRELRRRGCSIPIVALTANTMATDQAKCLDAGCDGFASKPIERKAFLQTLQELAGTRSEKAA